MGKRRLWRLVAKRKWDSVVTLPAARDLSGKKGELVTVDERGRLELWTGEGRAIGLLLNEPTSMGQAARIRRIEWPKESPGGPDGVA